MRRLLCLLCFLWHETRLSHLGTSRLSRLGTKLVYPARARARLSHILLGHGHVYPAWARDGDYADPHTSEESPRVMSRRRGRRARRPAPSRILQRTMAPTRAEPSESSRCNAAPSGSDAPSSQAFGGPHCWRTIASLTRALAGGRNALSLASLVGRNSLITHASRSPRTHATLVTRTLASHLTP